MQADTNPANRIDSVAKRNGVGRTTLYAAIKRGELIARKIGARTVILAQDEAEWLSRLPRVHAA